MKFILGKKIGMTQIWKDEKVIPVTKVKAGPCVVSQVKSEKKDSYTAIQLGFENKREKLVKKPQKGHFKKAGINLRYVKEFRLAKGEEENFAPGMIVKADIFKEGNKVDATAFSKGRGFQGVVKRYNFAGAPKTHGTKDQHRMPGSAGAMGVGRIFKGKRSPGRMGNDQITTKNLEIAGVDPEEGILLIKGAIAGANGNLVCLKGEGELVLENPNNQSESEEAGKKEEKQPETETSATPEETQKKQETEETKEEKEIKTESATPDSEQGEVKK